MSLYTSPDGWRIHCDNCGVLGATTQTGPVEAPPGWRRARPPIYRPAWDAALDYCPACEGKFRSDLSGRSGYER